MKRWWGVKKINPPKIEKTGVAESAKVLRESEKKLREAVSERKEVEKVTNKTKQLTSISNNFAELLEKAMRRSHG